MQGKTASCPGGAQLGLCSCVQLVGGHCGHYCPACLQDTCPLSLCVGTCPVNAEARALGALIQLAACVFRSCVWCSCPSTTAPAPACAQVPIIATLADTDGRIVYQNQASLKYWGALTVPQGSSTPAADQTCSAAGEGCARTRARMRKGTCGAAVAGGPRQILAGKGSSIRVLW